MKRENVKMLGVSTEGITQLDIEEEESLYQKDQKRLDKKYNSKKSPNFRLLAEYLTRKALDREYTLDKKKIMGDLKITMGVLNIYLSELNRYEKFQPQRWIAIIGQKDFIQIAGADFSNSHRWLKKNHKGVVSRTARIYQTREKVRLVEKDKADKEYEKKQKKKLQTISRTN